MKKTIYILVGLFLMIQTFVSCSKSFLDEKNYSAYAAETLTDSLGFQASLVGLYTQASYWQTYTDNQGWLCVWQVGTDIAYSTPNQVSMEVPYYNYALLTSTDGAASYTWRWAYQLINNANTIISSIKSSSVSGLSTTGKLRTEAEAKFFRAYAYNTLATCFGGVPLVTEPVTTPRTNYTRAALSDVDSLIKNDLVFAAANLPNIDQVFTLFATTGRANSAMAQQLLATAYLRMGQPAKAEVQCNSIISSGKFSLITNRYGIKSSQPGDPFSDMFIYGNQRRKQGNTEAIWVLEQENPNTLAGGSTGSPQHRRVWGAAYYNIAGLSLCDSLGGRSLARLRLNNWVLYKLYAASDMRSSRFNIRRRYTYNNPSSTYSSLYGKLVPYSGPDTIYKICPSITKWGQYDPNDAFGYGMWKDFILMRLGETYLLLAEAQFKQGRSGDAATTINILRNRAKAPLVSASDISLDFILDERARELLGEENRRMTLMRTGMLAKRALRLNQDVGCPKPLAGLDSTSTDKVLMPIPQSEIDLNKDAKLEQNKGY
ncbi:MAG: RagB/SusD family nutrient uptake outer membrane protein [Bacteroidota bacterium]|nr:RagB/SusD family nutrient uptake outer membrane protein [Bacteroidota bacterium]